MGFWDGFGHRGGSKYLLSQDPRLLVFLRDSSSVQITTDERGLAPLRTKPMPQAIFLPAGVPLWSKITHGSQFQILQVIGHSDKLHRFLRPTLGSSAALSALNEIVEVQDSKSVSLLSHLVKDELLGSNRRDAYVENLVGSILADVVENPNTEGKDLSGRLTMAQTRKLRSLIDASSSYRLKVGDLAKHLGLSEDWFSSCFKSTFGTTPARWLLERRIIEARRLLNRTTLSIADVAQLMDFSDQAHFSRAFRRIVGKSPNEWRRDQSRPDSEG